MSLYRGEKLISEMRVGKTVISDVELQEKSVTPTKSPQVVTPDSTFDGLSKVNVEAVPDNYIDTSDANATSADMLVDSSGYVDGVKVEGSVPRNGAVSKSLNCGESYTIPEGHHNGSGKVTANSLASQTQGNAGAANIEAGYTAWVNGVKVTGEAAAGYEVEQITTAASTSPATIYSSLNNIVHCFGLTTSSSLSTSDNYVSGVYDGVGLVGFDSKTYRANANSEVSMRCKVEISGNCVKITTSTSSVKVIQAMNMTFIGN